MVRNDEKWSEKRNHLSFFGWAMLFSVVFFWTFYVFGSCLRMLAVILLSDFCIMQQMFGHCDVFHWHRFCCTRETFSLTSSLTKIITEKGKCMSLTKSRKIIALFDTTNKNWTKNKMQCCTVWDFSQWRSPGCHNRDPALHHSCHTRPSAQCDISHNNDLQPVTSDPAVYHSCHMRPPAHCEISHNEDLQPVITDPAVHHSCHMRSPG